MKRGGRAVRHVKRPPPLPLPQLRAALLTWYRTSARELPWRRTPTPYRTWLSEIMLQQTQVKTVVPYFERFVAAFPTVQKLAAAPLERVMKLWEGLGYYTRCRNLHRAAQAIVQEHGGRFPTTAAAWEALPGIGRYTASAIASITAGEAAAVLDGNVKRVLARVLCIERSIDDAKTLGTLWHAADAWLDRDAPGDFNQAMMELGARVCTPRKPRCDACPIAAWCAALQAGRAADLPRRSMRERVKEMHALAAVVRDGGRVLVVRRPMRGLLAGLWGFAAMPVDEANDAGIARLTKWVRTQFGITIAKVRSVGVVRHDFTHRRLFLHVYAAERRGGRGDDHGREVRWVDADELATLAVSTLDRKVMAMLG